MLDIRCSLGSEILHFARSNLKPVSRTLRSGARRKYQIQYEKNRILIKENESNNSEDTVCWGCEVLWCPMQDDVNRWHRPAVQLTDWSWCWTALLPSSRMSVGYAMIE